MPSCKDIKRIVPRARMQEGIEKCKGNVADYLKDACIIAETGRLYHAIISIEFALEEFGKILGKFPEPTALLLGGFASLIFKNIGKYAEAWRLRSKIHKLLKKEKNKILVFHLRRNS